LQKFMQRPSKETFMLKLLSSAKTQYHAAYNAMVADPLGWNLYRSSAGVLLAQDFDGEVLVKDVALYSESQFLKLTKEALKND
jgi:hypothetical protein